MRRGAIILNGISRKKKEFYGEILPAIAKEFTVTVFETKAAGHARTLAAEACIDGFDFVIAAGGDGTLNHVLNGILQSNAKQLPSLGLIPLGSGNDFARANNITKDPKQLISLLTQGNPTSTDVGELVCFSETAEQLQRYFINCCSIGMGPDVVQRLERSNKTLGPGLTYLISIITTFLVQRLPSVKCTTTYFSWEGKVRVLAAANSKSFGDGVYIAPDAVLDDGLLNLFIAGEYSTVRFLHFLLLLKTKTKINDKGIFYVTTDSAVLTSDEPCAIETEGEIAGFLPANIRIIPKKINFYR